MDLGLHKVADDANSVLDPEVIAIADRITPAQSPEFGRVWDLFATRETPFMTEQYDVLTRNYTAPEVSTGAITVDNTESYLWSTSMDGPLGEKFRLAMTYSPPRFMGPYNFT